ncbi:TaqI-like C-terminal specificity domain-containing protein [Flaviramulus basaltis]|uniref:site-specific DNA-methyltransferase (adenine-specific) n=1 Tax=Flaviramulus basaltis TaxID=369401 RepID=A0A1K2IR55_9FLAO|nr:N-6 DNA methylase [Flaviramulus basaltis]SFZ94730.1 TaqI-like C-terminal specificity domain-containing protein [Flaviramulus basaltis]
MPLFQTSVLKTYITQQDSHVVERAYKKFTKYFHNLTIQENIKNSKEEQYQAKFLDELFVNVLDYTLNPKPDFNITTEFKNQKGAGKADGAILSKGNAIGVIELKGTNTKDLESIRKQAFDYKANQKGCVYVITSNFEKLRFYINDATEFLEFNLFQLAPEEFALLYLCLQKDNIVNNLPLTIKEASLVEEDKITKQFYNDYSVFKRELFRDLVKRNAKRIKMDAVIASEAQQSLEDNNANENKALEKNVKLSLFKKSQKLIDRFLFIFFAEDRDLLPPNSTIQILDKWKADIDFGDERPLYNLFKQYFHFLDEGRKGTTSRAEIYAYNGGLFKPDAIIDSLEIDDALLYKHAYKLAKYDFSSQVDVNILGHIFENSLNEIESVNAEIEGGEFDKQKSKRKKDGVFYTPKYITKYIVENTVGKLCQEKKQALDFKEEAYFELKRGTHQNTKKQLLEVLDTYRDWLLQITICDPACGSGAFLNQALDFLIKEHRYIDELKAKVLGGGFILSDIETTILENNIYGVDLNEESVEIAKLSLWLRTAQPRRKLNDLSNNIKCGNSLIDSKTVAGDKAFNWQTEFSQIFLNGGFDVVIGNPPWGAKVPKQQKDYIISNYVCKKGEIETYVHFTDLALNKLIKKNGFLGFITPNTWYYLDKYYLIRKDILKKEILTLIELEKRIFIDAPDIVPAIFIIRNLLINQNKSINTYKLKTNNIPNYLIENNKFIINSIIPKDWERFQSLSFNLQLTPNLTNLLLKIQKDTVSLNKIFNVRYGIKTGNNKKYVKKEEDLNDSQNDWKFCIPSASCVKKYMINYDGDKLDFGEHLSGYSKNSFERRKILIQYIRKLSMPTRLVCALDNNGKFYPLNNFSFVESINQSFKLEYLLAILNSKLMNVYFKNVHIDYNIKPKYIEKLPIKNASIDLQDSITNQTNILIEYKNDFNIIINRFSTYILSKFPLLILTRKLENWHELDFSDFIKELNKAIKKASGKPLTKKDEFEWLELFEENKKKAQDLQTRINQTEKTIDTMVYDLYGLTQEERVIVENS